MDREEGDPAFRAVERVLAGAVTKVLSHYHRPSRGKRRHPQPSSRPETRHVSSDEEDFAEAPPTKKKYPAR